MVYVIGAGLILAVFVLLVVGVMVAGAVTALRAAAAVAVGPPAGAEYSDLQHLFIVCSGVIAAVAALSLTHLGGAWWLLAVGGWVLGLIAVKFVAGAQRDARRAEQDRVATVERKRVAAQRERAESQVKRDRQQVERFGKDGAQLLSRARRTVKQIAATEAARDGWLGAHDGFGFADDLSAIEQQLARIVELRTAIGDAKKLPGSTDAEKRLVKDAEAGVKTLDRGVRRHIEVIEQCARAAARVDATLEKERIDADLDERRADVHGRLGALIYGVELTPDGPPSDAADAVKARVAAFHELKGTVELPPVESDEHAQFGEIDSALPPTRVVRKVLRAVGLR